MTGINVNGRGVTVSGRGIDAGEIEGGGSGYSDGFEDGDVSDWIGDEAPVSAVQDRVHTGDYAIKIGEGRNMTVFGRGAYHDLSTSFQSDGMVVDWYWVEDSSANGHLLEFTDSSGSPVFGVGSNNPQWMVSSGDDNFEYVNGGNSSTSSSWINPTVTVNFTTGEFTFDITDGHGNQAAGTRSIHNNVPIERIQAIAANGGSDGQLEVWYDDISITP